MPLPLVVWVWVGVWRPLLSFNPNNAFNSSDADEEDESSSDDMAKIPSLGVRRWFLGRGVVVPLPLARKEGMVPNAGRTAREAGLGVLTTVLLLYPENGNAVVALDRGAVRGPSSYTGKWIFCEVYRAGLKRAGRVGVTGGVLISMSVSKSVLVSLSKSRSDWYWSWSPTSVMSSQIGKSTEGAGEVKDRLGVGMGRRRG